MLAPAVEALYQELLEAFPSERSYGTSDLAREPMIPAVAGFLRDHLEKNARSAVLAWSPDRMGWVDSSSDEVLEALQSLRSACLKNAVLPADEWPEALRRSIERTLSHLVRPRSALVDAVLPEGSDDEEVLAVAERIEGIPVYPSFSRSVAEAVRASGVERLDRSSLIELVCRVDEERVGTHTAGDWIAEVRLMRTLARRTGLYQGIPVAWLTEFFGDRGLPDVADRLRTSFKPEDTLTADDLDLFLAPPDTEEEIEIAERVDRVPEPATASAATVEVIADSPAGKGPVPLWKQFQRNLNRPMGVASAEKAPGPVGTARPAATVTTIAAEPGEAPVKAVPPTSDIDVEEQEPEEKSQQPLWRKFQNDATPAPTLPGTVSDDVELDVLGRDALRNRDRFIDCLFEGAEEEYRRTVAALRGAKSWREASRVIAEDIFKRHQVNIYSEEAVAFTNAVEAQFRTGKRAD